MDEQDIRKTMNGYIEDGELSGCSLHIRKNGETVFCDKWGVTDLDTKTPVEYNTIFRLMSMTKVITAATIMSLEEQGELELDDPISRFVPEFGNPMVVNDARYEQEGVKLDHFLWKLLTFNMSKVKRKPAAREATIRDLLSHASGYEQGWAGLMAFMKRKSSEDDLAHRMLAMKDQPMDFEPGSRESYSPSFGFDLLGYITEKVTGEDFETTMRKRILDPLGMKDTTFNLNPEQQKRLIHVYERKKEKLTDVTDTKKDLAGFLKMGKVHYAAGCGGLYSTLDDYDRFGQMLFQEGEWNGSQILKPATVRKMHQEAQPVHLEPDPGMTWGLGVKIRQEPDKSGSFATRGTWGWSGAFGTHFFISPEDGIQTVFMANRSDLGGSGSFISNKVEELVFGIYKN